MNDNGLAEQDRIDFDRHLEKVVDVSLRFDPEPSEAAAIAFNTKDEVSEMLTRNCSLLGIKNIRVMKKAERYAHRLEELIGSKYPLLRNQIINSSTLYTWARFEPGNAAPFDFFTNNARLHGSRSPKGTTTEKEEQWQSLLSAYGYYNTDELDTVILDGVKNGFFDEKKLAEVAKKFNDTRQRDVGSESFSAAWDMYHDSFDNNESEVTDAAAKRERKPMMRAMEPRNSAAITRCAMNELPIIPVSICAVWDQEPPSPKRPTF